MFCARYELCGKAKKAKLNIFLELKGISEEGENTEHHGEVDVVKGIHSKIDSMKKRFMD